MLSYFVAVKLLAISVIFCTFIEGSKILLMPNGTIYASEGEDLSITCRYHGYEYHSLTWLDSNGTEIPAKQNSSRVYVVSSWNYSHIAVLVFEPVTAQDSSRYSCCGMQNNSWICENSTVNLVVNQTAGYRPRFDTDFVALKFVEGEDALLRCSADGLPAPEYSWLDTHGRNMYSRPGNWEVSSKEGWLLLYSVNKSQEGVYTCVARNIHGNDSKLYMVDVSRGRAPWFHEEIEYHEFSVGSDVTLECRAEGEPSNYTWYDNKGRNMHTWRQNWNASSEGLLQIYSIQLTQEGNYTCVALNEFGKATKFFELNAEGIVRTVIVKELWQTLVVFDLEDKKKLSELGYSYVGTRYREASSSNSTVRILWGIGDKYIVKDLNPGEKYEFEFFASKNWRSEELHLDSLTLTLLPFAPLVIVTEIKDTTVKIEFPYQTLNELRGALQPEYYVLRYVMLQQISGSFLEGSCPIEIQIPYCFGRWYQIGGLSRGKYYGIQVTLMLKNGPSHKGETIVYV